MDLFTVDYLLQQVVGDANPMYHNSQLGNINQLKQSTIVPLYLAMRKRFVWSGPSLRVFGATDTLLKIVFHQGFFPLICVNFQHTPQP